MKKIYYTLILVLTIASGFLMPNQAMSGDTPPPSPGVWMFTLDGNESNFKVNILEEAINDWFLNKSISHDEVDLVLYSKIDAQATSDGDMTVTYNPDKLSGTWSTLEPIEFYSVKASTQFAVWWMEGGATRGAWSTEHLVNNGGQQPAISHLSTWNPLDTPPPNTNVPEPATLMLLGFGLMGLAGMGRRTIKK